jgi:aspartokinase
MSITKLTEQYIAEHPSIKDALKKDLINYSALSRAICDELNIKKFDAVLIACRRYFWKVKNQEPHEKNIIELLKGAKLRVRNKIAVAIFEKPRDLESIYLLQQALKKKKADFNLIEGEDAITIVTNEEYIDLLEKKFRFNILKTTKGLVQITLIFNEKIETTHGVVSSIYSLLSENGVNINEEMSCWTDLMLIIDKNDLGKTMKLLSF